MDNLQKICSLRNKTFAGIIIFLVFSKPDIKYFRQGEISACKALVPIKVGLGKNDHFLHRKFEFQRYQQMNWFLYWRSFY